MPKRKTKMLSIRVSQDEYELLKNTHTSSGTRSVSAFAREAIRRILRGPAPADSDNDSSVLVDGTNGDVQTAVRSLNRRIGVLQTEVTRLSRTVAETHPDKIKD
jgi:hypothetical protein